MGGRGPHKKQPISKKDSFRCKKCFSLRCEKQRCRSAVVIIQITEGKCHGQDEEEECGEYEIQFLHVRKFQWGKYSNGCSKEKCGRRVF